MPIVRSLQQGSNNPKFFEYLKRETFTDCTLIADGHIIHAHKLVLAAASAYFEVSPGHKIFQEILQKIQKKSSQNF